MSRQVKLIVSDLHIGAGAKKKGNHLEDFTSDAAFSRWIESMIIESEQDEIDMELIINGDWIEFLQIPAVKTFRPGKHYATKFFVDATEASSLKRLEILFKWHKRVFTALRKFIHASEPRRTITILFGNHDPELAYPAVQARLRKRLGAPAVDVDPDLLRIGERFYFEDGVYIEHGNAYVEKINQFTDPDHPFDPALPTEIERPPGSHFVTRFFNLLEWDRPWVDGVHPFTMLIFYAIAFEPWLAVRLVKQLTLSLPGIVLGVAGAPQEVDDGTLPDFVEEEDERTFADRLADDPSYAQTIYHKILQILSNHGAIPAVSDDIRTLSDEVVSPEVDAKSVVEHYWRVLEEAADRIASEKRARVVAFGHIHEPQQKPLPSGAIYLNTGTWIWKGDFTDATDESWQDLIEHPEKYENERNLTYARIDLEDSRIVSVSLEHVDETSSPPPAPLPEKVLSCWARCLLVIKNLFSRRSKV